MGDLSGTWAYLYQEGINERIIGIMIVSTGILIIADLLSEKKDIFQRIAEKPFYFRWTVYYLVILVIIAYGETQTKQFIYVQF